MRYLKILCFCLCFMAGVASARGVGSVLSEKDVEIYRQIFQAQKKADFKKADTLSGKLKNRLLWGYVLYERYFSPSYKTKKKEITRWLKSYDDLAVAADVYALGQQKKAELPASKPKGLFGRTAGTCSAVFRPEPIDLVRGRTFDYLSAPRRKKAQMLMNKIYQRLNQGKTLMARQLVESEDAKNLFSYLDHDSARTALAFSYYIDGEYDKANTFIASVLEHSAAEIPQAYWVAGLISWRQDNYTRAGDYFMKAATHKKKYPLLEATASVWEARAYLRTGNFKNIRQALERAAKYKRLFYGIVAMRMLAMDLDHIWDEPAIMTDDVSADFSHPTLERFYALQQVGKTEWARKELTRLYLDADDEAKGILRMISEQNGFADDLLAVSGMLGDGSTRYPAPNWEPKDGWKVDRALVYAFVRQESCFNQWAESDMGAVGLMQIMPSTGKELAKILQYPFRKQLLKNPEYNLSIGQNYLLKLMNMPAVRENLMYIATAYNAGPGNLIKWKKQIQTDDPLLFLESIPSRETRSFVERIVVNYWIYRNLMGQPLKSLDTAAVGEWPSYHRVEVNPDNEKVK